MIYDHKGIDVYVVGYEYQPATGRLWKVTGDKPSKAASYEWETGTDLVKSIQMGTGPIRTQIAYDPNRPLKAQVKNSWSATDYGQYDYFHDALDRARRLTTAGRPSARRRGRSSPTMATTAAASCSRADATKAHSQPVRPSRPPKRRSPALARIYAYDNIGNRSSRTEGAATLYYCMDAAPGGSVNQYAATDDASGCPRR